MGMFSALVPVNVIVQMPWVDQVAEMGILVVVALIVLRFELQRRMGNNVATFGFSGSIAGCKQIIKHCAPEVAGVIACLTLAVLLRANPDRNNKDPSTAPQWEAIKSEWPILLTADTLLSLQAMLRFVVLVSVVIRSRGSQAGPVPLADEAAALSLAGQVVRVVLFAMSQGYRLDGPLGGILPVVFDVMTVPLLALIGGLAIFRRRPTTAATIAVGVAWLASRHHLNLADEGFSTDMLFVAAHLLDTLSACTYLFRSLLISEGDVAVCGVTVGFTHILMVGQQSLSTYYFLRAFDFSLAIVGAGFPYSILQIGNAVQLGTYSAAAVLFAAELVDVKRESPSPASPARVDRAAPAVVHRPTQPQAGMIL